MSWFYVGQIWYWDMLTFVFSGKMSVIVEFFYYMYRHIGRDVISTGVYRRKCCASFLGMSQICMDNFISKVPVLNVKINTKNTKTISFRSFV